MAGEFDQDDQDDRRDVDAAEIGQGVSDRPERRFGQTMQEVAHLR